jgi:hypothetical protein
MFFRRVARILAALSFAGVGTEAFQGFVGLAWREHAGLQTQGGHDCGKRETTLDALQSTEERDDS